MAAEMRTVASSELRLVLSSMNPLHGRVDWIFITEVGDVIVCGR